MSQLGKTILHYKILEKLGEGGMGVVYKAEDTKLKRDVAIKFLPRQIAASDEERQRFKIEAQAAAALNHPNITHVYAIEEFDDEMFIVMEYIEGQELKDIVGAQNFVPLPEVLDYATQIASGLQAAHEKDVTHRDIKSANIMVTDKGQVKIMDFGLAKVRGGAQMTKMGTTLGTAAYMSPEQAQGIETDHRTDIWAYGVVLYEMLTGKMPFPGDYEQAVIYAILNEEPEYAEEIPANLQQILQKALAKGRTERYQNIGDVLADLKTLTGFEALSGLKPVKKARPGSRQNKAVIFSGVAAVLVLAVLVVFWNRFSGDKNASKPGIKRIAVLPLENLGPTEQEYFADGITGEIISRLSGLSGLSVIARSSAMQYKNTTKSLRQIGEELNVDYILEGTLQWEENRDGSKRIRVNPELIKIEDATQVWSQPYEADFSSAFKLQADIAATVAEALNITLVRSERQSLLGVLTDNPEAYDIYLRAIEYRDINDEKRSRIAEQLFLKAIALDSNFAAAYAGLSTVQSNMHWMYFERSEENLAKSKANAERALALDPNFPKAHVAMGNYHYHGKLEYEPAVKAYNEAIRLQPNNAEALAGVGYVLRRQGKTREAVENLRKALEIDPRNSLFAFDVGETYLLSKEYDQAGQFLDRAILLRPDFVYSHYQKARTYLLSHGDTRQARAVIEVALDRKIGVEDMYFTYILFSCEIFEGNFAAALKQLAGIGKMDDQFMFKPEDLLVAQIYRLMKNESLAQEKYDSARQILVRKIAEDPEDSRLYSSLGIAYAGLGRKADAIQAGKRGVELMPISKEAWRGSFRLLHLAHIYTITGEPDLALDILDDLLARPTDAISVALLRIDPTWDPLRGHMRFKELLAKYSQAQK